MDKHTRFYIDLDNDDYSLLVRLMAVLTLKDKGRTTRADVLREGLRTLAKKEKVA